MKCGKILNFASDMTNFQKRSFGQWCRRYISLSLVVAIGIVIYILFFSDNSVSETYVYDRQIDSLNTALKQTNDSLEYYRGLEQRLTSDPTAMERVVREHYHMQRHNEDVYVVQ